MRDNIEGAVYVFIFLAIIYAVMRVVGRFTAAKYARVMSPLRPLINGTFSTDGDIYGWLDGVYQNRKVRATMMPDINEGQTFNQTSDVRYDAFEISVLDVAGAHDWKLSFGMVSLGQVFTREESWSFSCNDEALKQRLQASGIITALETFAGAGVRHYPTVIYSTHDEILVHRDNITPKIAPTPQHFQKQLDLVLKLTQINEEINTT